MLPNSVPGFGHGIGIIRGGLPDRGFRYLIPGSLTPLLYAARDGVGPHSGRPGVGDLVEFLAAFRSVAAREFGPPELELIELLGGQAALAVETTRLRAVLQAAAEKFGLCTRHEGEGHGLDKTARREGAANLRNAALRRR